MLVALYALKATITTAGPFLLDAATFLRKYILPWFRDFGRPQSE